MRIGCKALFLVGEQHQKIGLIADKADVPPPALVVDVGGVEGAGVARFAVCDLKAALDREIGVDLFGNDDRVFGAVFRISGRDRDDVDGLFLLCVGGDGQKPIRRQREACGVFSAQLPAELFIPEYKAVLVEGGGRILVGVPSLFWDDSRHIAVDFNRRSNLVVHLHFFASRNAGGRCRGDVDQLVGRFGGQDQIALAVDAHPVSGFHRPLGVFLSGHADTLLVVLCSRVGIGSVFVIHLGKAAAPDFNRCRDHAVHGDRVSGDG